MPILNRIMEILTNVGTSIEPDYARTVAYNSDAMERERFSRTNALRRYY